MPVLRQVTCKPSPKRDTWPVDIEPGVIAPRSITWVTPPTHPTSLPAQKIGTMVAISHGWTLPIEQSLLVNMSPGLMPGLTSHAFSIMYLIAAPMVPT
jgi:hypothetical protein